VPDDLYAEARKEFSEKELVDLTWAAAAINAWNRVSISMRARARVVSTKGTPCLSYLGKKPSLTGMPEPLLKRRATNKTFRSRRKRNPIPG
jgi:hypothetical protein